MRSNKKLEGLVEEFFIDGKGNEEQIFESTYKDIDERVKYFFG